MKKLLLFITMAASLLFTQCKKDDKNSMPSAGKTVRMTVTAGPGSKTNITPMGAITWSEGDKLYVGYNGEYIGCLTLMSGANSATGFFSGNVTLGEDVTGKKSFGFFYLGNAKDYDEDLTSGTSTFVDVDFSSQNIHKGKSDEEPLQNASACHVGYGTAEGTVTAEGNVIDINVMLVSKVALAHFYIEKDNVAYSAQLTLSGTNIYNKMTVNFDGTFVGKADSTEGGIILNNGNGDYYVMLVPTDATTDEQTLTFTGATEAGTATLDNIKPNQFYGKNPPIAVKLESTKVSVTGVSLDKTELSLVVGGTATLTATVTPDDATDKSVTWSSNATGVAKVDNNDGVVTAVALGEATITVTTVDGSKTATCTVTVIEPKFRVSDNTTVKFAPGNLYYDANDNSCHWKFEANQWGLSVLSEGESYTWNPNHVSHFFWESDVDGAPIENFRNWGQPASINDAVFFTNATDKTANPDFHVNGETSTNNWRTLSKAEWEYLLGYSSPCRANASNLRAWVTLTIAYNESVPGMVILPDNSTTTASSVTTKDAVASSGAVFLPAPGIRYSAAVFDVNSLGRYWSSTTAEGSEDNGGKAYHMDFGSDYKFEMGVADRGSGRAVRLVRDAE